MAAGWIWRAAHLLTHHHPFSPSASPSPPSSSSSSPPHLAKRFLHLSPHRKQQLLLPDSSKKVILALPDDQPLVAFPIQQSTQKSISLREKKLILIDGKAVVYRAYYKLMTKLQYETFDDSFGEGDWVLTVFTALSTDEGSYFFVVVTKTGLTFRHTLYSSYKLNRSPTPDTVIQALQYLKPALIAMGLKTIQVPGVEADDVIGTLAMSAVKDGIKVRVLSTDKDFFQLLSSSLRLYRFVPRGSGIVSFGLEDFQERFGGLQPSQFVDILALMGDRIDNIPGVSGIGEKTAVKLIKHYGSLEKLVEERSKVKGKRALEGLLADNGGVFLGKRLVTLRTDLPGYMVPFTPTDLVYKKPQDGGELYFSLLRAMDSFVQGSFLVDLENTTREIFSKY